MLSNKITNETLQSFASLRNDPRFLKVLDYLDLQLKEATERLLLSTDPVIIHKYQGAALTLSELISKARTAHITLKL